MPLKQVYIDVFRGKMSLCLKFTLKNQKYT